MQLSALDQAREMIKTALKSGNAAEASAALTASLHIFESIASPVHSPASSKFAGSVEYSIDDEEYLPHGRRLDVRISYDWIDYNRADEPMPTWGPTVEAVEVLAIHYFDSEGNEISPVEHEQETGWKLVNEQLDSVLEQCREDGYRSGAGEVPSWYNPRKVAATSFAARMSPSISTRQPQQGNRQLG